MTWDNAMWEHTLVTRILCVFQMLIYVDKNDATMTMTMTIFYSTIDIQIEIIMYNSLENQIINWSGDYY